MTSQEVDTIIQSQNYHVYTKDYAKICRQGDTIDHIKYDPFSNKTDIWTNDGYYWRIEVYY